MAAAPAQEPPTSNSDTIMKAVVCLKAVLEEALQGQGTPNEKGMLDTLSAIGSLGTIPMRVIRDTLISKVVIRVGKDERFTLPVREQCRALIVSWKNQLAQTKETVAAANSAKAVSTPVAAGAANAAPQATPHQSSSSGTSSTSSTTSSSSSAAVKNPPATDPKSGERWVPPPPKPVPTPAVSSTAPPPTSAAATVALPPPPERLRAAAADAAEASSAALEAAEEAIPEEIKEDPVVKEAREGKVSIRTEYECGEAVYTAVLEIRHLMRRTMGPARKTRQRATTDEKLLRAIAARVPDSDSILSQWRAGALTDQQCAQSLRSLPVKERSASAAEPSTTKATSRSTKDKEDDDEGMDFCAEEDDDEDDDKGKKARPKGRSKATAKRVVLAKVRGPMKRPAASLKLAFQKKRRT